MTRRGDEIIIASLWLQLQGYIYASLWNVDVQIND